MIIASPPLHDRRTNGIHIELGTSRVNVGSEHPRVLYQDVYQALLQQRPYYLTRLGSQPASIFGVCRQHSDNSRCTSSNKEWLGVKINNMQAHGQEGMFRLLVDAVSGIIEQGARSQANCRAYDDGSGNLLEHCNTISLVGIYVPGGNFIRVTFSTDSQNGEMSCESVRAPAEKYVTSLRSLIKQATGESDLKVRSECIDWTY
jgi:hypothetical protein